MYNRNTRYLTLCIQLFFTYAVLSILYFLRTIFTSDFSTLILNLFIVATYSFATWSMAKNIKKDWR